MAGYVISTEGVDRISSLPNDVLQHILSFMPTKYAVSTCVLSVRWRYLFPFSLNLDFDDSLVLNHQTNDQSSVCRTSRFLNFVDRCIMLMNGMRIYKLRVKCRQTVDILRVNSWICDASLRNIKELDVSVRSGEFGMVPICVFTYNTLVVLKLGTGFHLNVPVSVHFPYLKTLHLDSIVFSDDLSTQRLFHSCPVLEELVITGCSMRNIHEFVLSSPSVKRFTIDKTKPEFCHYNLVLDAPSLTYLQYTKSGGDNYTLQNLQSLCEANVSVFGIYDEHVEPLPGFFQGIANVQSLHLSNPGTMYPETAWFGQFELPRFENVTYLKLVYDEDLGRSLLLYFVHACPNLQELVFEGIIFSDSCRYIVEWYQVYTNVPSCMSSHLKVVEFKSTENPREVPELWYVGHFLKNANVLETMRIHTGSDNEKILEKLLMLPRLSETCKFELL